MMVLLLLHVIRVDESFRGLGHHWGFQNLTSELCEGAGSGDFGGQGWFRINSLGETQQPEQRHHTHPSCFSFPFTASCSPLAFEQFGET